MEGETMTLAERRARFQYTQIVTTRNADVAAVWSRFNIQWLINSAALLALRSDAADIQWLPAISMVAFLAACIWFWITVAGYQWLKFWNGKLAELESIGKFTSVFGIITNSRMPLPSQIATAIPVILMLFWAYVYWAATGHNVDWIVPLFRL
jgi:hypothetical protein